LSANKEYTMSSGDTTRDALAIWNAKDRDNPVPAFAALRALGAVHRVALDDGVEAWCVVRHDEAKAALGDARLSKDMHAALRSAGTVVSEGLPGPAFARHMLAVDPPDHTRLRRLVAKAFTNTRVDALRSRVQDIANELLDDVADVDPSSRPVDLVATYALPLPFTVICELLGVAIADRARFGHELRVLLSPADTPAASERARHASDAVVAFLGTLVAAKRATPGDDLVSDLIAARDGDDQLTEQELLSTIFQLIVAGHDTTASLLGNGLVALLDRPADLEALRADPARMRSAVEELLRLDAPVPHSTFRYATSPVDIGDVTIPAGAQVIISLAAANHDESRYHDPDELIIDRDETQHLSFGHGIHFCLGARLARMEADVGLTTLLRRFPELRLAAPRRTLEWSHGDGLVLRGLAELPVVLGNPA
jgi:cytochrome P450